MTFNSNALGQMWDACSPFIEGYFGRLDSINSDIKELEERLNAARFHETLWVEISKAGKVYGDPENGDFSVTVDSEILVWCKTGERWRLLYRRLQDHGDDLSFPSSDGVAWNEVKILKTTPLLEASADVRLRVEKALMTLVERVAKRRAANETEVQLVLADKLGEEYMPF